MVRLTEPWDEQFPLPELTEEEKRAMDSIAFDKIMKKAIAQLPISERQCWKVTDTWGNTIQRFRTKQEALDSAMERNELARKWKLWMRYRIASDQGFDE